MKLFSKLFIFLSCFLLHSLLCSAEKTQIISECFVSPNIEDFDCHSSCLIETSPQRLCAVWKGGPGKGMSNIDIKQNIGIWLSIFKDGKWNTPVQIVSALDSVCWTPVLTKQPDGELFLFYRIGFDLRHTISFFKRSIDEGISWSDAEILPAGIVGPTKSKPVFDSEGNMICGSSVEAGAPDDEFKATACWIEIFSKEGRWSKHGPIEIPEKRFGCIEPVLFWGDNGALKMLCRDRSNRIGLKGWIWAAESFDNGKTWSELKKSTLPNPDAGIDALSYGDGEIILIYNNSHTDRYPLTLALSRDNGNSWTPLFNLEDESGEFPSATKDSQGFIHVTYAYVSEGKAQRRIKHVIIDPKAAE
jgi:predicted neuraminidase